MKILLTTSLLLLAMMATAINAKELKIGVLDFARVLEESPQADKARVAMEQEFAPREKDLIDVQNKVRGMEDRLTRDAAIMSDSERAKLERQIISEKRDFKRKQDEFREDINFKRNELVENLQRNLVDKIRIYADAKGFDLLLAEGVIYAKDTLNVTEEVLQQLSKDTK